jgi:hypothetical protein
MTKSLSVQLAEIPLYLLPMAIARLIRQKGDAVYRISVKRTHLHHYNVSVRTKRIKKELAPASSAVFETLPDPAGTQAAGRKRRGCTA